MYNQPEEVRLRPLYQMESNVIETLHNTKEHIRSLCHQYLNHPVRVQTVHGQTFDGYIVDIDEYHVYLSPMPGHVRGFLGFGPSVYYNSVILPLVLYELLVISLLA